VAPRAYTHLIPWREAADEPGPHDAELIDLAAAQTLLHGGTVYLVAPEQAPEAAPLAAILRY
jgi:hypothetical protein